MPGAPFRLPPPPADFIGRDAELRQLRAAAQQSPAGIVGLFGPAGVGKTATALVLADRLAALYPDGQFLIDLQGSTRPLAPAEVMARIIYACEPLARLPEGEAAVQAEYRRVLRDRRALLLLDEAASEAQVKPLIPAGGCLLLVTGLEGFSLRGLHAVNLAGLRPEEARAMLLSLAPRLGQPAADRLGALCWQLPLALQLAGRAFAARADLDPGAYIRRLMDEQFRQVSSGGVNPVRAVLALAWELLPAEQRRRLQLLAVFEADFSREAAGAVWSLGESPTAQALDELVRLGLVMCDPERQRFWLAGPVRQAAQRRLTAGEREQARRGHAAHYAGELARADELYQQGDAAAERALSLFDRERNHLLAGQAWAAEHKYSDREVARLVSDYAAHGAELLRRREALPGQTAWFEPAVESARWLGDRAAELNHLTRLGSIYRHLGQPGRALEYYEQGLRLAREAEDRRGEAALLDKLGLAYAELGRPRVAADHYEQSLALVREFGAPAEEARTSWNLGLAYKELGDLPAAIAALQVCVDYERRISHPDAAADAAEVDALRKRLNGHKRL